MVAATPDLSLVPEPLWREAVLGSTVIAKAPLDVVQIDHTPVDLILVDPIERLPIGRPWVTVAIDVFSRCIAGFHFTLEAPSSTSVALCLAHVASDKRGWLEAIEVDADWPVMGCPRRIGARPRHAVIDLVGHENQSLPLLVLAEGAMSEHQAGIYEGRAFISDKDKILAAPSERHDFPDPHP